MLMRDIKKEGRKSCSAAIEVMIELLVSVHIFQGSFQYEFVLVHIFSN